MTQPNLRREKSLKLCEIEGIEDGLPTQHWKKPVDKVMMNIAGISEGDQEVTDMLCFRIRGSKRDLVLRAASAVEKYLFIDNLETLVRYHD